MLTPDELRQAYLDFFAKRGHTIIPSSSLVPENDPTTLFTGSGMQPLVPYFLGQPHPLGTRLTDSQKCFRSQDIEDIGDNRHTTYFEMLGNWSLGDYFKEDQLGWIFEFLTEVVGLKAERLVVTAYRGDKKLNIPQDDEVVRIWQKLFKSKGIEAKLVKNPQKGLQGGHIFFYGDSNWWSRSGAPHTMPVGEPGGPDSEIFYDFGVERKDHQNSKWKDQPCHPNCDCGRFLEIGNSVFMQYQKHDDQSFIPLPAENVDFGGGLERILAAHQDEPDIFKTQFFQPIIKRIEELSGHQYGVESREVTRSMRVLADHVRAAVMLAADGVYPGNKEREYFSRRLVRRAVRYAKKLGLTSYFMASLVPTVIEFYQEVYPEVKREESTIIKVLTLEEKKFAKALERGLKELAKLDKIDEEVAFNLYQSHGFPFELTVEIAEEKGVVLAIDKFEQIREEHKQQSKTASSGSFKGGLADSDQKTIQYHTATHLLHAALRHVLGDTVRQMGSHITSKRLRFDFSYDQALSEKQIKQVTALINGWINADLPVTRREMDKKVALASGAIAFFREKYPDLVSVYTIGRNPEGKIQGVDPSSDWISKEFCGGPHVKRTSEIAPLEIFKQKNLGQGVRRVYLRTAQF